MRIGSRVLVYLVTALLLWVAGPTRGSDADLAKTLREKGAKLTETQGVITGFDLPNLSQWSDDDFKKIGQLSQLKRLNFGLGLTNHQLSLLTHLPEVSTFTTNGSELDDEGVRQLAKFKNLTVLTFFHPSRKFTGAGLAELAVLPKLEGLSVGGSNAFGNEGMAAIGKLSHLKNVRIWHCNIDSRGLAFLKDLQDLRSIMVSYNPPAALDDSALAILASIRSLESVWVMETRLSLAALSQLKQLPNLTQLTLGGIEIAESEVEKLKVELPRSKIKWIAPTPADMKRIYATFGPK